MATFSPATVESRDDPRTPGRSAHRISGPTWQAVQAAIEDLMNGADVTAAEFVNPFRDCQNAGRWCSAGIVTRAPLLHLVTDDDFHGGHHDHH
jgi:hypothetical protein